MSDLDIRDLLVSCGASRYLVPEAIQSGLAHADKAQIRREAGLERASWESEPEDFTSWKLLGEERFDDVVAFLHQRIDATILGKLNRGKGRPNYSAFENWRS